MGQVIRLGLAVLVAATGLFGLGISVMAIDVEVRIVDSSGIPNAASEVEDQLRRAGYLNVETFTAAKIQSASRVLAPAMLKAEAETILGMLRTGSFEERRHSRGKAMIEIVLGSDYVPDRGEARPGHTVGQATVRSGECAPSGQGDLPGIAKWTMGETTGESPARIEHEWYVSVRTGGRVVGFRSGGHGGGARLVDGGWARAVGGRVSRSVPLGMYVGGLTSGDDRLGEFGLAMGRFYTVRGGGVLSNEEGRRRLGLGGGASVEIPLLVGMNGVASLGLGYSVFRVAGILRHGPELGFGILW